MPPPTGATPPAPSAPIDSLLPRLGSILRRQTGLDPLPFHHGCSPEALRQLEETLRTSLPEDYRALLGRVDGQPDSWTLTFPPEELTLLGVEGVRTLWRRHLAYQDDEFFDELVCDGKVRAIPFHPGRIPIAEFESGAAYLCLDQIPGPMGRFNQLIYPVDECDWVVVEDSVTALIARYVGALESGSAAMKRSSPDDGYQFRADGRWIDHDVYQELPRP